MSMDTHHPLRTRLVNREAVNPSPTKALSHRDASTGAAFTAVFTGEFLLTNPLGTIWNDLVQTGALVFSENANAIVGGCDTIKITANGSAITIPGAWKNIGSDAISIVAADVNRIIVFKSAGEIQYTNKLN